MKIGRLAAGLGGLLFAAALMLAPSLMHDPGGGLAWSLSDRHLDQAGAELVATFAVFDAIEARADAVPQHLNDWTVAASVDAAGGVTRLHFPLGGRVEPRSRC